MSQLVGVCGLVCSECKGYLATQAGDEAAIAALAAEWSQQFGGTISPDSLWCDGCTSAGRKCGHCAQCAIRACGLQRGLATCAECSDYRCEKLAAFLQHALEAEKTLEARRQVGT